jgi:hypothetical protein
MKSKFLATFLACGAIIAVAQARTWTNASDPSKTFEGELVSYDEAAGNVTVKMKGREMTFKQELLSEVDIAYAKENGPKLAATSKVGNAAAGGGAKVKGSIPDVLPDPDGKEADMSKPVQVFVMMGQSNMLGFGNTGALKGVAAASYPYLVDDGGNWIVRKDVRNVFFCMAQQRYNDWLTAENGNGGGKFGPEVGIGNYLGHAIDAPVMILKSCVGNRALGWDLLPPSAVGTGAKGGSYQGDSESSNRKVSEAAKAANGGWYAGLQYDQDVGAAQTALKDLVTYYPGATKFEVAGFFWWQGNAEPGKGSVENYDKNLAFLFNDLKKDFNAPNAKFVCATLGEHDKSAPLSQKMFDFAALPENKDKAAVFYSKPVAKGASGGHYGGDHDTYMKVGEGMGKLMIELLSK